MSDVLRYMIVDDNELDQLAISSNAIAYPYMQLAATCWNAADAMSVIDAIQPELVFLDVEMPGWTGLELLKAIREKIPIAVFITSHVEFAIDGFELEAFDYIVKPLTEKRFQ